MLEVHAILQRQRCNENITKKTGTLSDAYRPLHKILTDKMMTKVQPPIETNKINRYVIEDCGVINYWQSFVRVGLKVFF